MDPLRGNRAALNQEGLEYTEAALYRLIAAVKSGEMEPARASANAAVSRAIVGVYEAGLVESKIAELEAKIARKAA